MGLFFWFKWKDKSNDDFEAILNELEEAIRTREERLAFIKHRESRAVVVFTTYSILAWICYVASWWFGVLDTVTGWLVSSSSVPTPDGTFDDGSGLIERSLKAVPVGAVPVLIVFTRRIVKAWYRRKQTRENAELGKLRKRQKDQIDKLKKLSNYDKITEMLERHGQVPPSSALKQQQQHQFATPNNASRSGGKAGSHPASAYSTPMGGAGAPGVKQSSLAHLTPAQQAIVAAQRNAAMSSGRAGLQQPNFSSPMPMPGTGGAAAAFGTPQNRSPVAPPQSRNFLDRLADAAANVLLGDNENSPASKYALICQRCFAHNGLVLKDEVMDTPFACQRCGFLNPSRRARMTGGPPQLQDGNHTIATQGKRSSSSLREEVTQDADVSTDSITSMPSPTPLHTSRTVASCSDGNSVRRGSPLFTADDQPEPDTDSENGGAPGPDDGDSDSKSPEALEPALTAPAKAKPGKENLRKRGGKGRTTSTDMDVDE